MKKIILFLAVFVLSTFVIGCGSQNFTSDTIPREKFLVGGGFSFDYTAQTPGVCYLVDGHSRKILLMDSLYESETFNLEIEPNNESMLNDLKKLGIDPQTMKLKLYFIPSSAIANK